MKQFDFVKESSWSEILRQNKLNFSVAKIISSQISWNLRI